MSAGANPGSIGLVLNTTSVEHLMATALPLACYFGLNNKTIKLDIDSKSSFYHLILNSMHIGKVNVGKPSVFEQIPGTDQIKVKITEITADIELDGKVYLAYLIPLSVQKVTVTGMQVDLILNSISKDNVHW